MADPYRTPADVVIERGPRWGATRWAKLYVRACIWAEGREVWRLGRRMGRMIRSVERLRFEAEVTSADIARLHEELAFVEAAQHKREGEGT